MKLNAISANIVLNDFIVPLLGFNLNVRNWVETGRP